MQDADHTPAPGSRLQAPDSRPVGPTRSPAGRLSSRGHQLRCDTLDPLTLVQHVQPPPFPYRRSTRQASQTPPPSMSRSVPLEPCSTDTTSRAEALPHVLEILIAARAIVSLHGRSPCQSTIVGAGRTLVSRHLVRDLRCHSSAAHWSRVVVRQHAPQKRSLPMQHVQAFLSSLELGPPPGRRT